MGNSPSRSRSLTLRILTVIINNSPFNLIANDNSTSSSLLEDALQSSRSPVLVCFESRISEVLDYILTLEEKSLSELHHNDILYEINSEPVCEEFSIHAFKPIKVIGKGGFSTVTLARKRDTGKLYAIKTIQKSLIQAEDKIAQIIAEKDIMKDIQHPFIVDLMMTMQTPQSFHLVLEFCPGGELFFHLHKLKTLSEDHAKFYFSEILLAIEYLHKNDIVYRDLKPENILLDLEGHIKLIDFGLSKQGVGRNGVSFSFCGSPEYMSPEMLSGASHGRAVDIYGLGTLLYEMLVGLPPFYSQNKAEMEWNITNKQVNIPKTLSKYCQNLLSRLLEKEPENRIGYARGIDEIKNHPWCRGYPWNKIYAKHVKPPITPSTRNSNFSLEFRESQIPDDFFSRLHTQNNEYVEGFDFVSETMKELNRKIRLSRSSVENITASTKKTEEKINKIYINSEESCIYSSSLEGETLQVNEIPKFESKFLLSD